MITEIRITGALPDAQTRFSDLEKVLSAIGKPSFIEAMLTFAETMVGARYISVFCQGDRDTPLLVGTACSLGQHRADSASQAYKRHMNIDRNSDYLLGRHGNGDVLTIQDVDSIQSFTYRRDCYEIPRIASRISFIRRRPSYGLSLSLYSSAEDGPFPKEVYDKTTAVLGLLLTAVERHIAFTLKGTVWQGQDIQTRLALTHPDLTPREREVAAMTIKGRTASEIGEILGLAKTTVITHRKKAYARMNVSSLRELMASFGDTPR